MKKKKILSDEARLKNRARLTVRRTKFLFYVTAGTIILYCAYRNYDRGGGGGEKINGKKKNTTWTWRTEKNLSRPINTGVRASTGPRSFTRTVKISSFCSLPPCGARRSPAPRRFGRPARIDIARGFHRYNIVIIKIILYDTCSRVISIELLLRSRSRHDYETSTLL